MTIIDLNTSLCSPNTFCLKTREFARSLISSFQWPSSIAFLYGGGKTLIKWGRYNNFIVGGNCNISSKVEALQLYMLAILSDSVIAQLLSLKSYSFMP